MLELLNGHRYTYVTGNAGTGKTYSMQRAIEADPKFGVLCATTGIAAVNLGEGITTLHSLLRFYDADSLADSYIQGHLQARLAALAKRCRRLVIDEASMLGADILDLIYDSVEAINKYETVTEPFGILLTGDFCQLQPVKAEWAFRAKCWPKFAENILRLEKVWRQSDPNFLAALNAARSGEGAEAGRLLKETPARWVRSSDLRYEGTTIMGTNQKVDNFNRLALSRVPAPEVQYPSSRWHSGRKKNGDVAYPSEWQQIPPSGKLPEPLTVKKGAYVMILANDVPDFNYANGDCGWIVECGPQWVDVKLKRNENVVRIPYITRYDAQKYEPDNDEILRGAKFNSTIGRWVLGEVKYLPVRLAYAATVHKTQGLSLDNVQLDLRERFMGAENMVYVALSRCRTPEGLQIVGSSELLADRCNIAPEVEQWL